MFFTLLAISYFTCTTSNANLSLSSIVNTLEAESLNYWNDNNFIKWMNNFTDPISIQGHECDDIEYSFKLFIEGFAFPMFFQDLCNLVFHYDNVEPSNGSDIMAEMKNVINDHVEEDGTHLQMYLHDRKVLELDTNPIGYAGEATEFISFLFGPHTKLHRGVAYDLVRVDTKYNGDINPLFRYVIIEVIEISGKLLFDPQCKLYETYTSRQCDENLELKYLSSMHCNLESGDLIIDENKHDDPNIFDEYMVNDEKTIQLLFEAGRETYKLLDNIYQNFYNSIKFC